MATLLEITNKVLVRLREDEVADLSNDYSALVASFVIDIVEELNEETIWSAYDHEVDVTVVSGTTQYALTGTTNKSILLFDANDRPAAWIFDDSSDSQGCQMIYLDPTDYWQRYQSDRATTNNKPQFFTIESDTDFDDLVIRVWPEPSASAYIRLRFNTPQSDLDPSTDEATEIVMPERVVRLGALWMALNERGEEIGEPGGMVEMRYQRTKGATVENEIRNRERSGFYDWSRN